MAQYGYSAGYQGGGPQAVPSGFIEAYAQAGRNIGQGAQAIGSAIGESLQRYGQNKEENQFLTSRLESLAPYLQTVAQSGNIMDKNTPESKLLGDIEKFSSMSIPQKKATLLNAEFFLDRADKAKAREMQDIQSAAAQQQLAMGALQLGTAQREAAAAPYFTQALSDVMSMQPGQAPSVPYSNVTQEMLGKYGDKLTPTQMQSLIPMMRRMGQSIPANMTALGATIGPEGTKVEYGLPATVTSMPVPGTDYVQPMISGKAAGAPIKAQPKIQAEIDKLPEAQQKWANDTLSDINKNPQIKAVGEQFKNLMEIKELGTTPSDDIALIFKYMKTLDPTSVVRDNEFQTVGNAGGLPTQIQNIYNSYTTGNKLTPEIRRDIKKSADSIVRGSLKAVESTISDTVSQAKYRGVPEMLILPESSLKAWRSMSAQSAAESMQRFQSPEDMRAQGIKRGLVFNPATGKYQEFQD
jgi:hypothetical protein